MTRLTGRIAFDESDIHERFVRSVGARGQNSRKEATAVELRFDVDASSLPADVKERLLTLAGRHVTRDGVLVVVSRANRSQAENREAAHAMLVTLMQRAAGPVKTRRGTKPRKAVRNRRREAKMRQSALKRSRRSA